MLAKKIQIQKKKNQINRWLEISLNQEPSEHLQRMIESMKQEKRTYFLEEERILIYNTRELSKLESYLKEHASLEELNKILQAAIHLQEMCVNYLIPREAILFDFEHSYFDESKKELELIVLPYELSEAIFPFQDWVLKIIDAFPSKEEDADFLNHLYQLLQSQRFSIGSLKEELNREDRKRKEKMAFQIEKKEDFDALSSDERMPFEPFLRREEVRIYPPIFQAAPKRENPFPLEESFTREEAKKPFERIEFSEIPKTKKKDGTKKKKRKTISYGYFFLYELIMVVAIGLASFYAYSIYANPKKAILGLTIIWAMINYLIGKELLKFIKERRLKEETKQDTHNRKTLENDNLTANDKKHERAETIDRVPLCEETELLLERNGSAYFLRDLKNKNNFKLEKRITLLGRKYEDVDIYLSDKSIGRVHAIISIENKSIYLQDNDSLNGCFVNDRRLSKNERTEVKEGDHLRFATMEFLLSSSGA